MFKVLIQDRGEDKMYRVSFKHINPDGLSLKQKERQSVCIIERYFRDASATFVKGYWQQVAHGISTVRKGDPFIKETGRKLTLLRALDELGAKREERRAFWDAYFAVKDGRQPTKPWIATLSLAKEDRDVEWDFTGE